MVSIGVSVFSAIVSYLVWFVRVVMNAKIIHLGAGTSPGWAMGCHFVPFVNWVVPAIVMKEVADATFRYRAPKVTGYIVTVWWTAFVLRGLIQSFRPASPLVPVLLWVAGISAAWLIIRINLKQVDWREAGLPAEPRPLLVPAGGPRPVAATRLPLPVGSGLPAKRPQPGNHPNPAEAPRVIADSKQE